jgi:hypothetical protein
MLKLLFEDYLGHAWDRAEGEFDILYGIWAGKDGA